MDIETAGNIYPSKHFSASISPNTAPISAKDYTVLRWYFHGNF
jgi:hypothetical protein